MTATLMERICSRIVGHLGPNVGVLNHVPFGVEIVARYRAAAVRGSYSNQAKLKDAHQSQKYPARNMSFCRFVIERIDQGNSAEDPVSILEVGAGRAVNPNVIGMLLRDRGDGNNVRFVLLDKFVNPAEFIEPGIQFHSLVADANDSGLENMGPFDVGLSRATLSLMPPREAERAVIRMARLCRTLILNEVAAQGPLSRTFVRADKHMAHPYQFWLDRLGRNPQTIDWSFEDPTYNAIIVA